jgi:hypothetical protein
MLGCAKYVLGTSVGQIQFNGASDYLLLSNLKGNS